MVEFIATGREVHTKYFWKCGVTVLYVVVFPWKKNGTKKDGEFTKLLTFQKDTEKKWNTEFRTRTQTFSWKYTRMVMHLIFHTHVLFLFRFLDWKNTRLGDIFQVGKSASDDVWRILWLVNKLAVNDFRVIGLQVTALRKTRNEYFSRLQNIAKVCVLPIQRNGIKKERVCRK
jgi:hypothetical protein